jgi:hypothetical protein
MWRFLAITLVAAAGDLMAQSDASKFAEGLAALQKYHDCSAARSAFESESQGARGTVEWLDFTAQAAECQGDLAAAVRYYEQEQSVAPANRLIAKIGDLRYQLTKQQQQLNAEVAANNAYMERQRLSQEAARNVAPTLSNLARQLNGYTAVTKSDGFTKTVTYSVQYAPPSCVISMSIDYRSVFKGKVSHTASNNVSMNLAGISVNAPEMFDGAWHVMVFGSARDTWDRFCADCNEKDKEGKDDDVASLYGLNQGLAQTVASLLTSANNTCRSK